MKNTKFILLIVLFGLSIASLAQNRRERMDVDEFHERKWQFLIKEAELSPAEINTVKPIFLEYEKATWQLHQESREAFMKMREQKTDMNYSVMNDKYVNQEIRQAQLFRNYHLKLRKLLKPETLFKYYMAEKIYKRRLLNNMPPPPQDIKK